MCCNFLWDMKSLKSAKQYQYNYKQIDVLDKSNILSKWKLNIGCAADITIAEMGQKDMVTKSQIDTFKQVCLVFLLATIRKLFDKTKLRPSIMRYANPEACNFIKKRPQNSCFTVIFAKCLGTTILKNISERLLLIKNLLNQNMEALTITSLPKVKDHLVSNKVATCIESFF